MSQSYDSKGERRTKKRPSFTVNYVNENYLIVTIEIPDFSEEIPQIRAQHLRVSFSSLKNAKRAAKNYPRLRRGV